MSAFTDAQLELMHLALAAWLERDPHGFSVVDLDQHTCGVYTPHTFEIYRGFIIGSSTQAPFASTYVTLDIGLSTRLGDLDRNGDWYSRLLDVHEESSYWECVASLGRNLIDSFYYAHFRAQVFTHWRYRDVENRIMVPYFRPNRSDEWYDEIEDALAMMVYKGEGQMTDRRFFLCGRGIDACNEMFPPPALDEPFVLTEEKEPEEITV